MSPLTSFLTKLLLFVVVPAAVAAVLAWRVLGWERLRGLLAKLALLAVSLGLSLAVGEIVVRWALSDVTTTADNASFFAQRWLADVQYNTAGFREREITPEPAPGVCRIAVVGDSFAFGQGIAREDRFTERMQAELGKAAPASPVEVVNFGRPGMETEDHVELLDSTISRIGPDFILMQWFVNDYEGPGRSGRPSVLPLLPSDYLEARLQRSSALFYLVRAQWGNLQRLVGLTPDYDGYMVERFADPDSPDTRRAQAALRSFIHRAREIAPVGIVLFPRLTGDDGLGFLHQRVLKLCESEGIPCLDLEPEFARVTDPRSLWVNHLDPHPGPAANEIAARAILAHFATAWCGGREESN